MALYTFISALISSIRRDEEGQGLAEYALILALIAIATIVIMGLLGGVISGIFTKMSASI